MNKMGDSNKHLQVLLAKSRDASVCRQETSANIVYELGLVATCDVQISAC